MDDRHFICQKSSGLTSLSPSPCCRMRSPPFCESQLHHLSPPPPVPAAVGRGAFGLKYIQFHHQGVARAVLRVPKNPASVRWVAEAGSKRFGKAQSPARVVVCHTHTHAVGNVSMIAPIIQFISFSLVEGGVAVPSGSLQTPVVARPKPEPPVSFSFVSSCSADGRWVRVTVNLSTRYGRFVLARIS